jgi:hypothetical protein
LRPGRWNRIAIEWNNSPLGRAAQQFIGHAVAQLDERTGHFRFDEIPFRRFGVAFEFRPDGASTVANARGLSAEFRIVDNLFNVTQAVGPVGEIASRQRRILRLASAWDAGAILRGERRRAALLLLTGLTIPRLAVSLATALISRLLTAALRLAGRLLSLLTLLSSLTTRLPPRLLAGLLTF